jgi:hypothetical protein
LNRTAVLWAGRVVLALMFAIPAIFKLIGDELWAAEFRQIGFGMWFMYAVAVIELLAAGLILFPPAGRAGLWIMVLVLAGALVVQLALFGNLIHIAVYAAILGLAFVSVPGRGNVRP